MNKFKNTSFKFSIVDFLCLLFFAGSIILAIYFYRSYGETRKLFNIENTKVDFIIQAPSEEQIEELRKLEHIEAIVPYYYRSVSFSALNGNASPSLYIIDSRNNAEYTIFSENLKVKGTDKFYENEVYITEDLAKKYNLNIGDYLNVLIDNENISMFVSGIYKSDYRHVGGDMLTFLSGEVSSALKSKKYGGAYVCSNNISVSKTYFENEYNPLGDIRTRDEFDSEDAYNIYMESRNETTTDSLKKTFVTVDYINDLSKRNGKRLFINMILSIAFIAIAYILVIALSMCRTGKYTRNNVLRDVRDNYSVEQETSMYNRYFISIIVFGLLLLVTAYVFSTILDVTDIPYVIVGICICAYIISLLVVRYMASSRLIKRFNIEKKKYEEELKNKAARFTK